jgi:DNA-directed RNA polymerase subunit K/omega
MAYKHTRDEISLSSQDTAEKLGNIFDTVLVLSQRIRELKQGHAALINQGSSPLSTAMHEIAADKVTRAWLNREPPEYNFKRKHR